VTAAQDDEGLPAAGSGPEPAISDDEARAAADAGAADPSQLVQLAQSAPITEQFTNIEQTLIAVAEDKARLVLNDTVDLIKQGRDWMGPAGLFAGLLIGLVTGDFHEIVGVSGDTVQGMTIMATIGTGVWTVVTGFHAFRTPSTKKLVDKTIDNLKALKRR
jgi:hypothetical protein